MTHDKVYVLDYGGFEKFVVTSEIAVFDRDEVWLRSSDGGEVIYFEDGKHQVVLDGAVVDEHKGAAEVLAALTKQPRNGATALSE